MVFAESVVITGTVNNQYQVVTDSGQAYEIGQNDVGDDLCAQQGQKVEVKGTIMMPEEEGGLQVLMVTEFKIKA